LNATALLQTTSEKQPNTSPFGLSARSQKRAVLSTLPRNSFLNARPYHPAQTFLEAFRFLSTTFSPLHHHNPLIAMANYLASIFGTEADKVNCSFYYKIGACRHGDRCSRKHVKPSYSQTILLPNLYQNPAYDPKNKMNPSQLQNHFDAFYEDFWCEMCKFGEIEEVVVCDNNNDRMFPSPPVCSKEIKAN
jgi:hypothetical protein